MNTQHTKATKKDLRELNRVLSSNAVKKIKGALKTGKTWADIDTTTLKYSLISRVNKKSIDRFMSEEDCEIPDDLHKKAEQAGRVYMEALEELSRRVYGVKYPDYLTDTVYEDAGYFTHDGTVYKATKEDFIKAWGEPKNFAIIECGYSNENTDLTSCLQFKVREAEHCDAEWARYIEENRVYIAGMELRTFGLFGYKDYDQEVEASRKDANKRVYNRIFDMEYEKDRIAFQKELEDMKHELGITSGKTYTERVHREVDKNRECVLKELMQKEKEAMKRKIWPERYKKVKKKIDPEGWD